ncbi:MAG: hypothetical protein AMXMBFR23_27850 [Chloroflexota bacterium]
MDIVGIRFVEAGPIAYCSAGDLRLGTGDYVVVRTDRGERLGWVVLLPEQVIARPDGPLRVVDRLASEAEVTVHRERKERSEQDVLRAQAVATRIDGRVRIASLAFDLAGGFADVTYTAREGVGDVGDRLRRDLERELDARVWVEQVGDRDRAKAAGGLGQCGRALCCSTWMTEFPAISIKMAKDQGLAPNPSKISGACGRLLCCLSFEVDAYREIMGTLPKVGKRITTPVGRAKVLSINALTEMVRLRFDETGEIVELSTAALRSQMGTAVRPEDLEAEVEGPIHEEDRQRREHFVAVLDPIARPLRDTVAEPGLERAERADRPAPARRTRGQRSGQPRAEGVETAGARGTDGVDRTDRPARTRRRRAEPRAEGATNAGAPPAGTEQRSGVRITRRRRPGADGAPASDGTTPTEARAPREPREPRPPRQPHPAGEGAPGAAAAGEEEKRRRRRGRRGGRRRGAGGEGGTPAAE